MSTLLLRLAGPMQSWGVESRFDARGTGLEPSRSGVIGMLASALGLVRSDPIGRLAEIRMGVRVDRQGTILRDYQTITYKRDNGLDGTVQSPRFYLADAEFTVGIEHSDRAWLEEIGARIIRPARVLWLGRRSCLPAVPLVDSGADGRDAIVDLPLAQALREATDRPGPRPLAAYRRFIIETTPDDTALIGLPDAIEIRYDRPEGRAFDSTNRSVGHPRRVGIYHHTIGTVAPQRG